MIIEEYGNFAFFQRNINFCKAEAISKHYQRKNEMFLVIMCILLE